MALQKKPKAPADNPGFSAESFIKGAPDAGAGHQADASADEEANRKQISLTIDRALLKKVDVWAKRKGMSRAAAFALAVSNLVE